MDFLFFFGFSVFRLVRFRFLIRRSWVTSGDPSFLVEFPVFWWISCFLFFGRVSYFPFFFDFSIFRLVRFCSFHFLKIPLMSMKPKEGTPIRSRSRGRGALGLGGIEVSRDSRSVQPVFRSSL